MQGRAPTTALARTFVAGPDLDAAVESCRRLRDRGLRGSLFYLGEYVADEARIRHTVERKKAAARALAEHGFDVHVSVDPTQIGQLISQEMLTRNAESIARTIAEAAERRGAAGFDALMLDMEDASLVEPTIALHGHLDRLGLPTAITLQAYLKRTRHDLTRLISQGARVRLVKGAFAAGPDIAFTGPRRIRESFLDLSRLMLSDEAQETGFYPIFATHDDRLVEEIVRLADRRDWRPDAYELEMLYGVRRSYQESLARRGRTVRVYAPFGSDWWPYAARRIGETPGNIRLLLTALLRA